MILSKVGGVLLPLPDVAPVRPSCFIIAEDCFQLSFIPYDVATQTVVKAVEKLYGGEYSDRSVAVNSMLLIIKLEISKYKF